MAKSNDSKPADRPEGWHSVTPRLFVRDPAELVRFLKRVFGAEGSYESSRPSQLRIGDSMLMVSGIEARQPTRSSLYVYVDDVDAVYARALAEGATSVEEPGETPYGDWRAMVVDAFGNDWQIAKRR
jgi:PhnB protein